MAIAMTVEIRSDLVTKRVHGRILRDVYRKVLLRHRDHTLGKHYRDIPETRPGGAYGYESRSKRYTERKLRTKGHRKPLVKTGRMMREIRNNSRITATQHRGRLVSRNYYPMTVQRRQEVEVITPKEQRDIAKGVERLYIREVADPKNRRQRRRRV